MKIDVQVAPQCNILEVNNHVFYSSNRESRLAPNKIQVFNWRDNQIEDIPAGQLIYLSKTYATTLQDCHNNDIKIEAADKTQARYSLNLYLFDSKILAKN